MTIWWFPPPPGRKIRCTCLSSSTRSARVLIAWEDHRALGIGDIYGTLFDAATRSASPIIPGGPGSTKTFWKSVSAGEFHTLGIRSDGSLWSWGKNDGGQLGVGGPLQDKSIPTRVGGWLDWTTISGGGLHSLGIRSDGSLWAWGKNDYGQLGTGDPLQDKSIPTRVGGWLDWWAICRWPS